MDDYNTPNTLRKQRRLVRVVMLLCFVVIWNVFRTDNLAFSRLVSLDVGGETKPNQLDNEVVEFERAAMTNAQKYAALTLQQHNKTSPLLLPKPPHTPGAFVHLGKTGGSTLCALLRNACHSWIPKPCGGKVSPSLGSNETFLSKLSTYYHTPDMDGKNQLSRFTLANPQHAYDFFAVTLRDPLDRTISAFTYDHPKNVNSSTERRRRPNSARNFTAETCFDTLEIFAQHLQDQEIRKDSSNNSTKYNNTSACRTIAHGIVNGAEQYRDLLGHLHFNTRMIMSLLKPHLTDDSMSSLGTTATNTPSGGVENRNSKAVVLAIRTEHIWEDWTKTNRWLGQPEGTIHTLHGQHNARNQTLLYKGGRPPVTKELSDAGRSHLCRALKNEYDAYFFFIDKAVNLNKADKEASYDLAKRNCPELWDGR